MRGDQPMEPTKRKSKGKSKFESLSIKKAKGGFVVEEYRDNYDDNVTHIAEDKEQLTALIDSVLGKGE